MVHGVRRRLVSGALVLAALLVASAVPSGHEIPNDVTIQTYIVPESSRLLMLVRAPLLAMRDMTWPFRQPDVLDLARAPFELHNAATLWIGDEATLFEDGRPLPPPKVLFVRATPGGDRSFESYERAMALLTGPPLPEETDVTIKEGFLDILFEYTVQSGESRFSIDPRWGRLGQRAMSILSLVKGGQLIRTISVESDPGLVHLDPTIAQTIWRFVRAGFLYARDAADPLLILLCLVMPFRRAGDLVLIVAAFILAHSLTLLGAGYFAIAPDTLAFQPAVATVLAIAIVYVAFENVARVNLERRWMTAFACGLAYGFSFGAVVGPTLQFAGAHVLTSVLAFNAGVELALLAWLALIVAALRLVFRWTLPATIGLLVFSGIAGHSAWHRMTARGALALQYQFGALDLSAASLAILARWLMFAVAGAAVLWGFGVVTGWRRTQPYQ